MAKVNILEDKILILLAVNTGLRRRDLTGIEIANIDIKKRSILYYENKKRRYRTIYISSTMAQELEIYLNTLPKKQKMLLRFRDRTAYNRLNKNCRAAGIPERPFHALRATWELYHAPTPCISALPRAEGNLHQILSGCRLDSRRGVRVNRGHDQDHPRTL